MTTPNVSGARSPAWNAMTVNDGKTGYMELLFPWQGPSQGLFRIDENGNVTSGGVNIGGLQPSGDPTGTTDTANIQGLLNLTGYCLLAAETFVTSAPIVVPPYATLRGQVSPILDPSTFAIPGSVIKPSASWAQGSAAAPAVILMLGETSGGYSGQSQDQTLQWFSINGSNISGTIHGIEAYDSGTASVNNVTIDRVFVFNVPGTGLYLNSGGGTNPLAWRVSHSSFQKCGGNGVGMNTAEVSITDTTWTDIYVLGCGHGGTADGWVIGTCSNSQWIGCRGEGSTGNGFTFQCHNSGGNGVTFVGCSTQGNQAYGFEITTTGGAGNAAPIQLIGFRSNDDGKNGTSGGGGYAGIYVTAFSSVVSITNYLSTVGTTGATYCPEYSLKVASNSGGTVLVNGGSLLWGYTAAYNLDGTGTVLFDPTTAFATGSSPALTVPGTSLAAVSSSNAVASTTGDLYGAISGALAESMPRWAVSSSSITASSGQAYFRQIILPAGITVTNVVFRVGGTAKTDGTHGWYALCDLNNKVLAVSTDQTDPATTWGTTNTDQALAVTTNGTAKFTTAYSGVYYAVMMVAESGGTMPNFCGTTNLVSGIASATPLICGTCPGGSTTAPAVGTALGFSGGSAAENFYAYVD